MAAVVDGIWSLQYMAAGPICGTAGPLSQFRCAAGTGASCRPFSHAVLFRYANPANRERFEGQPRVQLMLGGTGAPPGTQVSTLNFQGRVPSELEAIFRRGGEWAEGVELVLALALQVHCLGGCSAVPRILHGHDALHGGGSSQLFNWLLASVTLP